ncbi:MAG: SDR family NAD(P)-dependent oxidoreductase, partial [Patescibacteria group bacterium]|nr:SDR family NAD(P)-dependent oxidoreductase [Patescibacteria group bacterium]
MFDNKTILITGGTGSLGQALTERLLSLNPKAIRIFSRDENKQVIMAEKFQDDRLRFLIGDVRDKERLRRAVENVDIVIHAAALKHVPVAEYNPFEFIKTNIDGSQNVVDVSMDEQVKICLAISTDKAVSPLNLYGATKLAMEKLFIAANHYKGKRKTRFSCVRYGNVLGSRGSVIPKFIEQIKSQGMITVTDPNMTRFNITMDEALDLIINALNFTKGSEVFIPKLSSYKLSDLVDALHEISKIPFKTKKIPVRIGEKHHEVLLNEYESKYSIEYKNMYVLLPPENDKMESIKRSYANFKPCILSVYSSDT